MEHTPEPWKIGSYETKSGIKKTFIQQDANEFNEGLGWNIARMDITYRGHATEEADARRIVACVNFCAGVSNYELRRLGSLKHLDMAAELSVTALTKARSFHALESTAADRQIRLMRIEISDKTAEIERLKELLSEAGEAMSARRAVSFDRIAGQINTVVNQ